MGRKNYEEEKLKCMLEEDDWKGKEDMCKDLEEGDNLRILGCSNL